MAFSSWKNNLNCQFWFDAFKRFALLTYCSGLPSKPQKPPSRFDVNFVIQIDWDMYFVKKYIIIIFNMIINN